MSHELSNEEVWQKWKDGEVSFDVLYEGLKEGMRKIAWKFHRQYSSSLGMDLDDWLSHGMYAIYSACERYKLGRGATLKTYSTTYVVNAMGRVVYLARCQKRDDRGFQFIPIDKPSESETELLVNMIIDERPLLEFDDIQVRELCQMFSEGDELLEKAYYSLAYGGTKSEVAKEHGMLPATLIARANRNCRIWQDRRDLAKYSYLFD